MSMHHWPLQMSNPPTLIFPGLKYRISIAGMQLLGCTFFPYIVIHNMALPWQFQAAIGLLALGYVDEKMCVYNFHMGDDNKQERERERDLGNLSIAKRKVYPN